MGSAWDSTWSSTKGFYKNYMNPDPKVDYTQTGYTSNEEKLSALFAPVDRPMGQLAIYLNSIDAFPTQKWLDELFKRFPWVNGCEATTLAGETIMRRPETTLKPLNLKTFMDEAKTMGDRKLRSYVDITPMGPEIYMATGMFKANDLVGFISVHFDPRSLVKASADPDHLMIITPEAVIWPGTDATAAKNLVNEPWQEMLADEVKGHLDAGGKEYYWLARYFGQNKVIYATEAAPEKEDDSFLWFF